MVQMQPSADLLFAALVDPTRRAIFQRLSREGELTADKEPFMTWRSIDRQTLDSHGRLLKTETLIQGLFRRDLLLDYLRNFIIFEEDGEVVKKIAAYL